MTQLFISYSRKDTDFARKLTTSFEAEKFEAWVDWQDIPPSVDWMNEIQKGIEGADIFIFIVSPDSIISPVCAEEVKHAVANGKRIIPIIAREVDVKIAPATISHLNWIFFSRPQDKFEESFGKILTAIRTDYDWVQTHRRLQIKALEWERGNHENSLLLRGKDLQDAEAQIMVNGEKPPKPTNLQREYISNSAKIEAEELEKQRAKEQQLELEKSMGSRLRRLTYVMLGVFTVAFIALFFWLNVVTSNLAINSIKNQMLALVETSVCFFNINGDSYQEFIEYFPAGDETVYQDDWFPYIAGLLSDIKATNKNIQTDIKIYTVMKSDKADEILFVISTDSGVKYKTPVSISNPNDAHITGMEKTAVNKDPSNNLNGSWITACAPIVNSRGESIGALCTDFSAELLDTTRADVRYALGIAFFAIYPAMALLVISGTRSVSKMMGKVKKNA